MEKIFIGPDESGKITQITTKQNIDLALEEIQNLNNRSFKNILRPIYKTLWEFSFENLFVIFGLKHSVLYRLTKSQYSKFLPNLIVVHHVNSDEADDAPLLVERKLFVPHNYFKNWLLSSDNELFEEQILELILSQIQASTPLSSSN